MKKTFYCANCGKEIENGELYMFLDNYLQVKYFDDNASNRFCSRDCACESLMLETVDLDEAPLDEGEEEFDEESIYDEYLEDEQ